MWYANFACGVPAKPPTDSMKNGYINVEMQPPYRSG